MAKLKQSQHRALDYLARIKGSIGICELPANVTPRTVAALSARGLVKVEISLTARGSLILESKRLAERRGMAP